jgi:ABC-type transporter Mla subunit MlaD
LPRRANLPNWSYVMEKVHPKIKHGLEHLRKGAQELQAAMSDAAAKHGGAVKADIEAASQKAKAVAESAKAIIGQQNEATKKHLTDAVAALEATQKHAAEAMKSSGHAFETAIQQIVADTRTSVQKIGEAVAETHSTGTAKSSESAKSHKK